MNPDIADIPLRDIHLPESVSWWPLAPGWWITLGLFLLAAAVVYFLRFMKNRRKLQQQSLNEFDLLVSEYKTEKNATKLLIEISALLRRVSITLFGGERVAGLTGHQWLGFLDQGFTVMKEQPPNKFQETPGQLLINAQYQKTVAIDEKILDDLLVLCKAWLVTVTNNHKKLGPALNQTTDGGQY